MDENKKIPPLFFFFFFNSDQTVMIGLLSIKVPLPRMLKQQWCCACQIRNKHHLKEEGGIWMSESKPGAGILSCRWRRRGEASFSIHEVSWPFACHARALCVQLNVHASACACVRELQAMHLRPTHIFVLSRGKLFRRRKKNMSTCVSALGAKCVCVCAWTHKRMHTQAYMMFMQDVKQVGGGEYSL